MSTQSGIILASSSASGTRDLGQFSVYAYGEKVPFEPARVFLFTGLLSIAGLITGLVFGLIRPFVWIVILFPCLIGVIHSVAGRKLVRQLVVRHLAGLAIACLVSATLSLTLTHYITYLFAQQQIVSDMGISGAFYQKVAHNYEVHQVNTEKSTQVEEAIRYFDANPDMLSRARIQSFSDYLYYVTTNGLVFGFSSEKPLVQLGATGTGIYLILEIFLAAIVPLIIFRSETNHPFCNWCGSWKMKQTFGPFTNREEVLQVLENGELKIFEYVEVAGPNDIFVAFHTCPRCQNKSPVDVTIHAVDPRTKEASSSIMSRMTYPEKAYTSLHLACCVTQTSSESGIQRIRVQKQN